MFFIGKNEIWNSLGILHIPKMPTLWSSEVNNVMRCAIKKPNLKNIYERLFLWIWFLEKDLHS